MSGRGLRRLLASLVFFYTFLQEGLFLVSVENVVLHIEVNYAYPEVTMGGSLCGEIRNGFEYPYGAYGCYLLKSSGTWSNKPTCEACILLYFAAGGTVSDDVYQSDD